ncbi:MAG: deoxynucleoside kinase [Myxococcota bacterium]
MPAAPRHIAVEGPPGAGKSLVATRLAELMGARAVLEPQGANPFLEHFLRDKRKYAFQTQVFYLLARHQQLQDLIQGDLFSGGTVTDYLFERERIFAALTLSKDEQSLYERIYQVVRERVPRPDLVIYLQARPDVLYARLRRRGQTHPPAPALRELEEMTDVYNDFFFHYQATPLLVVNTNDVNLADDEEEVRQLALEAMRARAGARHYIPRMHSQR